MKKLTLLVMSLSTLAFASETKFLGILTIDNYPIDKCKITKIGTLISYSRSGYYHQNKDINKKGLLSELNDAGLRDSISKVAVNSSFNAILGYKLYTEGAFDTFEGGAKNGNVAYGVYRLTAQGTPVLIKCD